MIAADIVVQLQQELPNFTDKFTDNFDLVSLTRSGNTVTGTTSVAHGFQVGSGVNIVGALSENPLISLESMNGIGFGETQIDHDLTLGYHESITIEGANESEYNGTFKLVSVPNRRTFTFEISNSAPATATGSPILLEQLELGFVGFHQITAVPTATTFEYEIDFPTGDTATGDMTVKGNHRISSAAGVEISDASYTRQPADNYWAYVILDRNTASKDRGEDSDFVKVQAGSVTVRQSIRETFSVLVYCPATQEISTRKCVDEMKFLFPALSKSLLTFVPDAQMQCQTPFGITFIDHYGTITNLRGAVYVHQFDFEQRVDITINDVFKRPTRAFRDVSINYINDFLNNDSIIMTSDVNLDEEPIN